MSNVKMSYITKRKRAYNKQIPLTDQMDAVLKAFDMVLQADGDLPYELIDIIEKWQNIKSKYPKE